MKQKFIDCMMKFSHDAWGGDSIPSTEKSFAEVFDVLVKAGFIQEWQPIETAPKDGTMILVCHAGLNNTGESYFYNGWQCWDGENHKRTVYVEPTHWQPLPPPPKTGE